MKYWQLLIFLCVACHGYGQDTTASNLLSVSIEIVGKGSFHAYRDPGQGYFTVSTVTNRQDTTIRLWIMSCGWPWDNWVASNDSVHSGLPGCDSNFPIDIKLLPHQSVRFYDFLVHSDKTPFPTRVKLGFRYFFDPIDLFGPSHRQTKPIPPVIYWSNEVELTDNLFKFQIDPVAAGH